MKFTKVHMFLIGFVALLLGGGLIYGFQFTRVGFTGSRESFQFTRVGGARDEFEGWSDSSSNNDSSVPVCNRCSKPKKSCGCSAAVAAAVAASAPALKPAPIAPCPRTVEPDLSKYILKSQVPSTNSLMPDMTNYMLKTECPPVPDLSKYVLKSSIPKPQPVIVDNSSCMKDAGECPPCPRPRCPEVKCPAPTKCAPPAPCPRPVCPPTVVKCKSEEQSGSTVRPFLAPLNMGGFGMA
jgi:hypothetical protein